ncbi:MAG: hypothetical protein K9G28_06745, partial [Candidatus Nanopelagicales bacterium]|nr:hypothetical protein [Candidatus Nanopelagicales bacterium]
EVDGGTAPVEPEAPQTTGDPITDLAVAIVAAQRAYDDGQAALARGDFAAYGAAQDRLKAALDAIAAAEAQINGGQLLPEEPVVEEDVQSEGTAA